MVLDNDIAVFFFFYEVYPDINGNSGIKLRNLNGQFLCVVTREPLSDCVGPKCTIIIHFQLSFTIAWIIVDTIPTSHTSSAHVCCQSVSYKAIALLPCSITAAVTDNPVPMFPFFTSSCTLKGIHPSWHGTLELTFIFTGFLQVFVTLMCI